ncbi:hypothetical protein [Hyphococcus sp.]|uniref:hypothetical protein n=1 Tax=Hyphococcus sp. TaxID=2038636 RepID=UPI003CCBB627
MPCVKSSSARLWRLFPLIALCACANSELARFAPPGIVKYEDIAGDQPVNPQVAGRIAERKSEPDTGKFPILAQTPAERPEQRSDAEVELMEEQLLESRENLELGIVEDRAAAAEEAAETGILPDRRDTLRSDVDRDKNAAARERREQIKPPPPPEQ